MRRLALRAKLLGQQLVEQQLKLVLAESCTGGWVAKVCTDVPGSSRWLEYGIVSYSNSAKRQLLGVSADTLRKNGAVSQEVAFEMAQGVVAGDPGRLAIAVTGIAGPDGGSDEKPVGLVWFAWLLGNRWSESESAIFEGSREAVREQSVEFAIEGALTRLSASAIR
ncbi:MAG: CinA family protein [Gammaproteobacteria bacterium]|nr:CinA family protein [Gammaproteobacteria bacterium]